MGTATGLYGKISATFDNVIAKDESGNIVLTDDFSSSTIDSDKWGKVIRKVSGGALLSEVDANTDTKNNLEFKYPEQIKEVQASVTLLDFSNPNRASTRARLGGHFYNDTGDSGSGNLGDVWAEISLGGEETTPSAYWLVKRYINAEGTDTTTLGTGTFPVSVNIGETYNLFLGWDEETFTFKCNENVANYIPTSSIFPPNNKIKNLGTRVQSPDPDNLFEAFISASFDDVMVNGPELSPIQGTIGTEISITGFGFGTKKGKVLIGGVAAKIAKDGWKPDSIICTVTKVPLPAETAYDIMIISKEIGTIPISKAFTVKLPEPVIDPGVNDHGAAEVPITINGNFFGTKKGKVYLEYLGKNKNCKVTDWNMNSITFLVPKKLAEGTYPLNIANKVGTVGVVGFTIDTSP